MLGTHKLDGNRGVTSLVVSEQPNIGDVVRHVDILGEVLSKFS